MYLVSPGSPITYTLTFTNLGSGIATNVVITDPLPSIITNLNVISTGVVITDSGNTPSFVWNIQDLAPTEGGTIVIRGQIDPTLTTGSQITNTATITTSTFDLDGTNNTDIVTADLRLPNLYLTINKSVTPTTNVTFQGVVTYTITLNNLGLGDANNVTVMDTLPLSTTFAGWIDQPAGANLINDQLIWTGPVTAGQTVTFTFVVNHTGDYGDVVTNTAEYSSPGDNGDDSATFIVEASPLLPTVAINDVTMTKGDSGTTTATFEVTLSAANLTTVTVNYDAPSAPSTPASAPAHSSRRDPTTGLDAAGDRISSHQNGLVMDWDYLN